MAEKIGYMIRAKFSDLPALVRYILNAERALLNEYGVRSDHFVGGKVGNKEVGANNVFWGLDGEQEPLRRAAKTVSRMGLGTELMPCSTGSYTTRIGEEIANEISGSATRRDLRGRDGQAYPA